MNGLWLAVVATCMAAAPLSHFSQSDVPPDWNIPRPVWERLDKEKLLSTYEISTKLNPFYLRGDFDGDGKPDYAVLIESSHQNPGDCYITFPRAACRHSWGRRN